MATTQDVLAHHLQSFGEGNIEELLRDYTDESTFFTPAGVLHGREEIRSLFEAMLAEFGKPGTTFAMRSQLVEGETAYIVWSAETPDNTYELGTDTLVVRDGKIAAQSFAGKITPKA